MNTIRAVSHRRLAAAATFILSALALPGVRAVAQGSARTAPRNLELFLLVGQSNMAGRGTVEMQDSVAVPRVYMLDAANAWVPAREPMHFDKPKVVGVGPGRAFGVDIATAWTTAEIGLIPAAVGGSSIRSWAPGALDAPTKTHPYDEAVARARAALASGRLAGILWLQGETDSNASGPADYEQRMRDVIANLRRDLNAPDVPFLIGQMGRFAEKPWTPYRTRVDSLHQVVARTTPGAAFVRTDGLKHRGDTTHYDTPSVREIGHRYARTFLVMQPTPTRK